MPHPFLPFTAALLFAFFSPAAAQDPAPLSLKEAKAKFEKADASLNQIWETVKKNLLPADFAELKDKQKDWLVFRDSMSISPGYSGAPSDEKQARLSPEYFETAAALTEDRCAWLKAIDKPLKDQSLTGRWSDSYGGLIDIVQKNGKLYFSISVVRGPTAHGGDLSGVASWNDPLGWFSDKGLDPEKKEETNLSFRLEGNRLEIAGANTQFYHGARAYFDGHYLRTGDLSTEEQKKLIEDSK